MNTAIDQIKPETLELIEAQAEALGLSVDEYLRRLLPRHEKELALKADENGTSEAGSAVDSDDDRKRSIEWIKSHRQDYGGLFVALRGDVLIASGKRYGDVLRAAREKGIKDAFIGDVLPLDYEGSLGGWD